MNNFQSIRADLFKEVKVIHDNVRRDQEMEQFAEELANQNRKSSSRLFEREELEKSRVGGASALDGQKMISIPAALIA